MNGRIFILIAATGLFVHVWNANDPARKRQLATEGTSVSSPRVSVPEEESNERRPLELSLEITPSTEESAPLASSGTSIEEWSRFPADPFGTASHRNQQVAVSKAVSSPSAVPTWVEPRMMPESLPPGIACGLYQLVDNFGHVSMVQVSQERLWQLGLSAEATARDLYLHQEGNQRWYFIRQGDMAETSTLPAAAKPDASLVSYPLPRNPARPDATSMPVATDDSATSIPLSQLPVSLVRRQEKALRALAQAEVERGQLESINLTWDKARRQLGQAGERLQGLAMQVLIRWPAAAQWLPDQVTFPEVQVLPELTVPNLEVELPSIPLLRTAQPDRPSPM